MTSIQLNQAALKLFVKHGFDGTSLAHIAEDVGIKKQSIYAHYKNKDDLFLTVLEGALSEELHFIEQWLQQNNNLPLEELLYQFLQMYRQRFEQDDDFKFGLRMSFHPPAHLHNTVMEKICELEQGIERHLQFVFEQAIDKGVTLQTDARTAMLSYLVILDSICVELVYTNLERTTAKIEAAWNIYWRGVSKPN